MTLDLGLNFKKEGREIEYLQYLWRAFHLRDLEAATYLAEIYGRRKIVEKDEEE